MANEYLDSITKLARKRQLALTKEQEKAIYKVYAQAGQDYFKKFMDAKPGTATKALYAEYAHNLAYKLQDIINEYNIEAASNVATMVSTLTEKQFYDVFGLDVPPEMQGKSAVAQICNVMADKSARSIILGDIYKDGKGLSKRIWQSVDASCNKINEVVAQCMAQQLSATEMSKVLKAFMKPGTGTEWDRQKIKELLGPGYSSWNKNLCYEALRLARTTITHSATVALKQSAKLNPYLNKCVWHSVHAMGRTCEQCKERDGQVFTIDKVPFDHPNGLCWNEPILDKSLDEIGDELLAWIEGKPNQRLKEWEQTLDKSAKGLGIKWKTPVEVKQKEEPRRVYTRSDIDELHEYSKKWVNNLTREEYNAIHEYTGSTYREINNELRGLSSTSYYAKTSQRISEGLSKFQLKENMMVFRGSDLDMLYHLGFDKVYEDMMMYGGEKKELNAIKKTLMGEVLVDKGFMSTSAVSGNNFDKDILFKIELDKTFKGAAFVKDLSQFAHENEVLLDKGTGLVVKDVSYSEALRRWIIDVKAIN